MIQRHTFMSQGFNALALFYQLLEERDIEYPHILEYLVNILLSLSVGDTVISKPATSVEWPRSSGRDITGRQARDWFHNL